MLTDSSLTTCSRADAGACFNYTFLTLKERDIETGLDYFGERYYASAQGRFISVDPLGASAIVSDPQSFNRYTYVLNNPLKYVDPDGLDAKNPWDSLTDKERQLLASKLTTVTGKGQMKAAGETFKKLVQELNKDGSVNENLTNTKIASVQNLVGSIGGDSKVWDQVQSLDKVTSTGDGKQSDINLTVKNNGDFIAALKETKDANGYKRFVYMGEDMGHHDSTRELGYSVTDPSMHFDSDKGNHFGIHWDPSTGLKKDTWGNRAVDAVLPLGIASRAGGAAYHWIGPRASTGNVRQSLKTQGLVPQH